MDWRAFGLAFDAMVVLALLSFAVAFFGWAWSKAARRTTGQEAFGTFTGLICLFLALYVFFVMIGR